MLKTLLEILSNHGVRVMASSEASITVESVYSKNGKALYVPETIPANFGAVEAYLGY